MSKTIDRTPRHDHEAIMESLAGRFAQLIREGQANPAAWRKGWKALVGSNPMNVETRHVYTGGNHLLLALRSMERGWGHDWSTYNGWGKLGGQVRKGEKGTQILQPRPVKRDMPDGTEKTVLFWGVITVFNAAQQDGWTAPEVEERPVHDVSTSQEFLVAAGATVRYGGDSAFYDTLGDYIQLPHVQQFADAAEFGATAMHELTHWTGHKDRLNRFPDGFPAIGERAFEELVAELGAASLCNLLGIEVEPSMNHAHYLASWLKALHEEPKALWKAATVAAKATRWLEQTTNTTRELQPAAA